jgi:hypothetical protein
MQVHDRVFGQLAAPYREIVLDIVVEVAAVDVEQVDRPVREVVERIFERGAHKGGESGVSLLVARRY